mmetsp:Transcript_80236/g.227195  ORF Transcript_80236/g.227195 Transcript_80236/m.227195 type:complete len:234 (+) Transcript_80236:94-795(+)
MASWHQPRAHAGCHPWCLEVWVLLGRHLVAEVVPVRVQLVVLEGEPRAALPRQPRAVDEPGALLRREELARAVQLPLRVQPQGDVPQPVAPAMQLDVRLPAEQVGAVLAQDLGNLPGILGAREPPEDLLPLLPHVGLARRHLLVRPVAEQRVVDLARGALVGVDRARRLLALHRRVALPLPCGMRGRETLEREKVLALLALHPRGLTLDLGAHDHVVRLGKHFGPNLLVAHFV